MVAGRQKIQRFLGRLFSEPFRAIPHLNGVTPASIGTKHRWVAAAVAIAFIASVLAHAQGSRALQDRPLQVDVNLVLVNATVTDPENRYVTGLEREHFQVWEDKVEQRVEYFSAEDAPLSAGIVLDTSGSMKEKIATARDAAVTFLKTGSPDDEYLLAEFNSRPEVTEGFTTDISRLQNRLIFGAVKGMTALYDAIYLAVEKVKKGSNAKKAILLITDGEDNHSHYTFGNVSEIIKESEIQMYAIGIADGWNSDFVAGQQGRQRIEQLTESGGGRAFFPDSVSELEDITTRIAVELKNQYVLGYISTNANKDGKWRKIRAKVKPPVGMPRLSIRTKGGYYAPIE